jgi:cytochrome c
MVCAAAVLLSVCWGTVGAVQLDDEAILASLPEGPGKEEAFYACHGCHSFFLVRQQRLSRTHWDELLDWMVEEQGMPEIESEERELILDYLETNYGETTPR